ncbi:Putative cell wall binding repeat-containing protein [Oribacterium sp. KHPX15]|uniref:hypothetical protein n=1 Tax=Oribacterium sp. KHPX15 TaxID=1855342 RepID=UPI000898CE18|nr:hypothetical protein [Oribacterium sp. KHPX15]SEA88092.1 Putative cell wall binding repeat-containing protein [Oribacterium sp. KHPX15]
MMKRYFKALVASALIVCMMSITAYSAAWTQTADGNWYFIRDDGTFALNNWELIDGKYYYFDAQGRMLANTTTPDGYYVGADGAWVQNTTTTSDTTTATSTISTSENKSNINTKYKEYAGLFARSIKDSYPSAEFSAIYCQPYTNEKGENCVAVVTQYRIRSVFSDEFLYNISNNEPIYSPKSYYSLKQKSSIGKAQLAWMKCELDYTKASQKAWEAITEYLNSGNNIGTGEIYTDADFVW